MINISIKKVIKSYIYRTNAEVKYVINHKGFMSEVIRYHLRDKHHICVTNKVLCGDDLFFPHPQNIVIGLGVTIGCRCTIYQDVTLGQNRGEYPHLGDDIIVYPGAKIMGDIHIGNRAIIGANSLVIHDVPEDTIVGGVPAGIVGKRGKGENYY